MKLDMRQSIFMLMLLAGCSGNSDTASSSTDYGSEAAQIMDVIKAEYRSYFEKNYEVWSGCMVQEDYYKQFGYWEGYPEKIRHYDSWTMLKEVKQERFDVDSAGYWNENEPVMEINDVNIQIRKDVAWVTFRQRTTDQETGDFLGEAWETRILEKINGQWKIAYHGWLYSPMERAD
jgi:hypothetical protein